MMYTMRQLVSFIICGYSNFILAKETPLLNVCRDPSDEIMGQVVDVVLGATVSLECNFCNVQDDFEAKLWFFKSRGSTFTMGEIKLPMDTNITDYKIAMTSSHQLIIQGFDLNDAGVYACHNYNDECMVFVYVLDGVYNNRSSVKIGKMTQWQDFNRSKLEPLNEKFYQSEDEPFRSLRESFGYSFKLSTVWESWSPCLLQGKHKGIRKRHGHCRLSPVSVNSQKTIISNLYKNATINLLQDAFDISCYSLTLNKTLPEVSKLVKSLPNFEITEQCEAFNSKPHIDILLTSKETYKYKIRKHVGENSHTTLVCPEVALDSSVEWFKDDEVLDESYRNNMGLSETEPSLTIDAYNSLYILHATKKEEGLYSCSVDGVKKKEFYVVVVSKSKLINQEFIRYSIYLGFVLSLTLTCYCAGICVAWHRRSSFASPMYVKDSRNLAEHLLEREKLLQ